MQGWRWCRPAVWAASPDFDPPREFANCRIPFVGLYCRAMALLPHIPQGLLCLAALAWLTAHGPLFDSQSTQASYNAWDLPAEPGTGQEGTGQAETEDEDEGQRSSEPTVPQVVLAFQSVRVDLAQPRRISSHHNSGSCRHEDTSGLGRCPVDSLESAVRLNRSLAMDFATRVPQLWRHAPPA